MKSICKERTRSGEGSLLWTGLGVQHSDCLHPCGSAIADPYYCPKQNPSSVWVHLPSLHLLSPPQNDLACLGLPDAFASPQLSAAGLLPARSPGALSSGPQEGQAQLECCQLQETPGEIKSTSLTTSLPNRPRMCN
jgi:hypothetical protein